MSFSYSASSSIGGGDDQYEINGSEYSASHGGNSIATDLLAMLGGQSGEDGALVGSIYATFSSEFVSEIEQSILRADNPIEVSETEELTVLGHRGVWVNRQEVSAWRGDIAISEYRIHEDSNPKVRVNPAHMGSKFSIINISGFLAHSFALSISFFKRIFLSIR